jgi:hypothetical protein
MGGGNCTFPPQIHPWNDCSSTYERCESSHGRPGHRGDVTKVTHATVISGQTFVVRKNSSVCMWREEGSPVLDYCWNWGRGNFDSVISLSRMRGVSVFARTWPAADRADRSESKRARGVNAEKRNSVGEFAKT